MRLLILSRKRTFYSTARLRRVAKARGHEVDVIDPLAFHLVTRRHAPSLFHGAREVASYDVVVPRIGAAATNYALAVVRQLDMMGVRCLNSAVAIARSRDKLRTLQVLTKKDIDIPPTACVRTPKQLRDALLIVGGPPVIVKLPRGTQGVGVMLAETQPALEALLETLWGIGQDIIVQRYVAGADVQDVRALVVGGRVVAAMRRTAKPGEFRANRHRGAACEAMTIDRATERVALAATRVMRLEVAGVDLLVTDDGPKVLEINASPGFEGIEKATGADVAGAIIMHAERFAALPRKRARPTTLDEIAPPERRK